MKKNPVQENLELYNSQRKEIGEELRRRVALNIYDVYYQLQLLGGEDVVADLGYTAPGQSLVISKNAGIYWKGKGSIVCRQGEDRGHFEPNERNGKTPLEILSEMTDHHIENIAENLSRYLDRKEWEKEPISK